MINSTVTVNCRVMHCYYLHFTRYSELLRASLSLSGSCRAAIFALMAGFKRYACA